MRLGPRPAAAAVAVTALLLVGATASRAVEDQVADPLRAEDIGGVETTVSALLLSGQRGGEIGGAMTWTLGAAEEGEDDRDVLLTVEVDGTDLLAGQTGKRLPIAFYAYALDPAGRLAGHLARGVVLEDPADIDRLRGAGLRYADELRLGPGHYSLRVMVRNHATGTSFLSWSMVEVPAAPPDRPTLLPPLVAAAQPGGWLEVVGGGEKTTFPVLGAARPVVVSERPVDLLIGAAGWNPTETALRAVVRDRAGRTVAEPDLEVRTGAGRTSDAVVVASARIPFLDLPSGEYTLELAADPGPDRHLAASTGLLVATVDTLAPWPVLERSPRGGAGDTMSGLTKKKKVLEAAYLDALRVVSAEGRGPGAAAVARFERGVAELDRDSACHRLCDVELGVARRLAKTDPEVLAPLAALHRDLVHSHLARGDQVLVHHSRIVAVELAELAFRHQPDPIPEGFAEAILLGLAGDLAEAPTAALELLGRILDLAPAHRAALLTSAALQERTDHLQDAVQLLERLVAHHPDDLEGRLRLGVDLLRSGRAKAAEEALRDLLELRPRGWIDAVAHQELVSLLVDRGRLGEAEQILRAGRERHPDDQTLAVQLVRVLTEQRRFEEALTLAQEIDRGRRRPSASPRVRYAQLPEPDATASRALIDQAAGDASPAMAAALAEAGSDR